MPITKEEVAEGLEELGGVLSERGFIESDSPLRNARKQLSRNSGRYIIKGLRFREITGEYLRGGLWEPTLEVVMNADIEVNGTFEFSNAKRMIVDVEYSALSEVSCEECKGCWHMDYHVQTGTPKFMHPDFHLHHGGHKMRELENFGDTIILDNPRVMHHPLDAFLGIDFIISNFYPEKKWQSLRADSRYKKLLHMSQRNWWKPFYEQLANYWQHEDNIKNSANSRSEVVKAKRLNPQYI